MSLKQTNTVEKSAKNVEAAIAEALAELGAERNDVEIEVLEEGSKGFFGIGAKVSTVRVTKKAPDIEKMAVDFLREVTLNMGFDVTFHSELKENNTVSIEMEGNQMGILIGKRGDTLDALQYLTSLAVNKNTNEYVKINLDTENYRQKRQETLIKLAKKLSSTVIKTKKSITLEPMNPNERRIIHYTLQNNRYVKTYSVGDEPNRKVVITLK